MAELRVTGRVASGGFAAGPVAVFSTGAGATRGAGEPVAEAQALRDAIAAALEQLWDLAANAGSDGADILAFQIAMLEDETLSESAFASIGAGVTADRAWRTALDAEICGYEAAEDVHFKARASDLRDIRDRVAGILSGAAMDPGLPSGAILVGEDLTPSRFLSMDWSGGGGIALTRGSASGHVATLARARGVPMIVRLDLDLSGIAQRSDALIDGARATLTIDPETATREDFAARAQAAMTSRSAADEFRTRPALTADGTPIAVCASTSPIPPRWKRWIPVFATESVWCARSSCSATSASCRTRRRNIGSIGGSPNGLRASR